jgi:hypothetical protein
MSTSGEFVEILEFDTGNEESSEETTGCKASVYAEFNDCPTTRNLVEILRFTHFARVFKFNRTPGIGKKKEIFHEIKVSVGLNSYEWTHCKFPIIQEMKAV